MPFRAPKIGGGVCGLHRPRLWVTSEIHCRDSYTRPGMPLFVFPLYFPLVFDSKLLFESNVKKPFIHLHGQGEVAPFS